MGLLSLMCLREKSVCWCSAEMIGREKSEIEDKEVSNTGVSTLEMRMCTLTKIEEFRSKFSFTYYVGGGTVGKESSCQCRRQWFDPWWGSSPGGGNGNPLLYSCLEHSMDRGALQVTVHGGTESDTTEQVPFAKKQRTWLQACVLYSYFAGSSINLCRLSGK